MIPKILDNDAFWSYTITYFNLKDLNALRCCHPYFYYIINIKKEIYNNLLKRINFFVNPNIKKIQKFLISTNSSIGFLINDKIDITLMIYIPKTLDNIHKLENLFQNLKFLREMEQRKFFKGFLQGCYDIYAGTDNKKIYVGYIRYPGNLYLQNKPVRNIYIPKNKYMKIYNIRHLSGQKKMINTSDKEIQKLIYETNNLSE